MGEIADRMIDGTLDCETGEYIGKAVGYPRTLNNNANNPANGVKKYIKANFDKNNIKCTNKDITDIIRGFFTEDVSNVSNDALCVRISNEFPRFVNYIKRKNK